MVIVEPLVGKSVEGDVHTDTRVCAIKWISHDVLCSKVTPMEKFFYTSEKKDGKYNEGFPLVTLIGPFREKYRRRYKRINISCEYNVYVFPPKPIN